MPAARNEASTLAVPALRLDGRAASGASAAGPKRGDDPPQGAPRPEGMRNGERRERARSTEHGASGSSDVRLRDLLRGLRAGDLESVLLTVAMAAEENRMPSADPDEAARILGFLARLAEHDTGLPPPPDGSGSGPACMADGIDARDGAPTR